MKYIALTLFVIASAHSMEHSHIEAHSNGNTLTIDIESAPRELPNSMIKPEPVVDDATDNKTKLKIAGITAGSAALTACTALCTAVITAGVTVAVTYSQCNK